MPKARKMLSDWKAPYIQPLMKFIETQSKSTLAHWAVDYVERVILPLWNKYYPYDQRPQNALNAAREWLSGAIKLPPAKKVILDCHAAAREADGNSVAQTAARAIGQCASTIHSARHCIGLAFNKDFIGNTVSDVCREVKTVPIWLLSVTFWAKGWFVFVLNAKASRAIG